VKFYVFKTPVGYVTVMNEESYNLAIKNHASHPSIVYPSSVTSQDWLDALMTAKVVYANTATEAREQ